MYITNAIGIEQIEYIYNNLFSNIKYKQIDVFLCGGMSIRSKKSYRDQMRDKIESDSINVLYPEDLFMEMLNRKKYDLLTLEAVLARNCDVIVLFPESPGSYAELGAFSNNVETANKLVVFQHNKFKRAHSFISQGPISYMQRFHKGSVYYFNKDMDMAAQKLLKVLRSRFRLYKSIPSIAFKDIDQLTGLVTFSMMLLYFYDKVAVYVLKNSITELFDKLKKPTNDFDIIYNAAIKLMFKRGIIEKRNNKGEYYYCLTNKGVLKASIMMEQIALPERSKVINRVRLDIIKNQLC